MNELKSVLESVRINWIRVLAVGAVVTLIAVAAPVIWVAVAGGVGLVALGIVLAGGFAALQLLPLLGQKLENRLLAARKSEARRNPIEQMQNHLLHRARQIESFRGALTSIYAQIEGMQDMLRERRRVTPGHDLTRQEAGLKKMSIFYAQNVKKLGDAEGALADYRRHIEMKVFEWNFAQAGRDVLEKLKATDQERILRELLSDEASQSVQLHFNQVFAELDMEVRSFSSKERLDFGSGLGLDMSSIHVPVMQAIEERS
jgi:hypothetical protein